MPRLNRFYTAALFTLLSCCAFAQHTYTTTFPAAENPISEGGLWLNGGADGVDWSNVQTNSGRAYGNQTGGTYPTNLNDSVALLQNLSWGADQYVQATVSFGGTPSGPDPEFELWCRGNIQAKSITGYEITYSALSSGTYYGVARWNGAKNNFTSLNLTNNVAPLSTGDVLKATCVGSTITLYRNGTQLVQITDSTYATGAPGLGFYHSSGGDGTDSTWGFSSFTAGTAPSPPTNLQVVIK